MDLGTQHILAIVNGYSGQEGLQEAVEMIQELLEKTTLLRMEEKLSILNNEKDL